MDVVRCGINCHSRKRSKESKFCQIFLHCPLSLSQRNQLVVCCLHLINGFEVEGEYFEEVFEGRILESFVVVPDCYQVCFFPF